MKRFVKTSAGFSMVEIIAVTLLMSLLIGMVSVGITANVRKGRIRTAKAQIGTFGSAVTLFELECGFFPTALEDLVQNSSGKKCKDFPAEGFMDKKSIPMDPWNEEYGYRKPGTHNTSGYDIWSNGPDKEEGSDDDIGNWDLESSEEEEAE